MNTRVRSFDCTEACVADVVEPDRYRDLFRAFDDGACSVRGAGLSYCLASAAAGTRTVATKQFDRILAFDAERRLLTVEPGMTVGRLSDLALAHDSLFPVLPGHPSITLGGCAGFNVHGKTQHNVGHFSDHVDALTVFHPDHGETRCSRDENADLFDLTLGGMGLTGCIVDLTLQLQPLPGNAVRRRAHRVTNLRDAVERMRQLSDADALYSWNDLNCRGDAFGKGVLWEERFERADVHPATKYRTLRPSHRARVPLAAWNATTVAAMRRGYPKKSLARPEVIRSVHDAAFPINGNEIYFALFGRSGFHEYQMILAHDRWLDACSDIERALVRSGLPVTLGSLKLFRGATHLLWFRDDGICLTIDTPAGPDAVELFRRLDRIALAYDATVNLSKDSRLDAPTVAALFPEYDAFRSALEAFDPKRRFETALRRRIEI